MVQIVGVGNRRFKCARSADCMYKTNPGRCTRAPRFIAVDHAARYGNQREISERYPYRVDLHWCSYRGAEVFERVTADGKIEAIRKPRLK